MKKIVSMKDVEQLCFSYRRGTMSPNGFVVQLIGLLTQINSQQPSMLNVVAERLMQREDDTEP